MMRNSYYDPNKPYWLDKSIARAERKLEMLHIRQKINDIDMKLQLLSKYAPQKADEEQPSVVHTAPSSDQESLL